MSEHKIFGKIAPERAAMHVVQRIEILVLEGVLRNGQRLPSERDLAIEMDVSRPVVREALKILESKGNSQNPPRAWHRGWRCNRFGLFRSDQKSDVRLSTHACGLCGVSP